MASKVFTFLNPFLSYIDDGRLFRNPFRILYGFFAIVQLLVPVASLVLGIQALIRAGNMFGSSFGLIVLFIVLWLVLAVVSLIGFQIWWDRKDKLASITREGDDFIATPVFSHLIQTTGEWLGTWLAVFGFFFALLTTIFSNVDGLFMLIGALAPGGLSTLMRTGVIGMVAAPVTGFLVIVGSRFLAEQFRALTSIANNTSRSSAG